MAFAVLCASAGAATSTSCTTSACHAALTVGATTTRYSTPESFFPSEQQINVRLSIGEESLKVTRRRDCETRYAAPGIRATVRSCAEGAPIRLFAHRIWGGTVSLRMSYRAVAKSEIPQGVEGIHAGSGTISGTGGVGPQAG